MTQWFGWSLVATVLATGLVAACTTTTADEATLARKSTSTSSTAAGDDDDSTSSPGTDSTTGGNTTTSPSDGDAGATTTANTPPPAGAGIPCDISAYLAANCTTCHGDPPINGSLSGLVTIGDLLATAKEDATKNEAQLSLSRMMNTASPMPPKGVGTPPSSALLTSFQTWINGNYVGSCATTADAGTTTTPVNDPFANAGPYNAMSGGSGKHHPGQDCMGSCHNHGFTFAGTLFDKNGNAVQNAEVRLVDAKGNAISVYSGQNGNFYSSKPWTPPAHIAARDATDKAIMVTPLAKGGCNACHANGGSTTPIHLP